MPAEIKTTNIISIQLFPVIPEGKPVELRFEVIGCASSKFIVCNLYII